MGKVNIGRECLAYLFMVRKLFPVVSGDGVNNVFEWLEQGYRGFGYVCCALAVDPGRYSQLRHPLDYCHQGAAVALTDHRVDLPVSDARLVVNDLGSIINADTVLYLAAR